MPNSPYHACCFMSPSMSSELLAQGGLEHLAVVVFGYAVDKEVGPRPFVPRDGVEAQAVERLNRHRRLRTGHDESDLLLPYAQKTHAASRASYERPVGRFLTRRLRLAACL